MARPSQRYGSSTRSSAKGRARTRNIGAKSHARRPRTGDVLESAPRGAQDAYCRSGRLFVVPAESGTVAVHRRRPRVLAGPHASLVEAKPLPCFRTVAGVISRPGGSLTPMAEWLLPAGRARPWLADASPVCPELLDGRDGRQPGNTPPAPAPQQPGRRLDPRAAVARKAPGRARGLRHKGRLAARSGRATSRRGLCPPSAGRADRTVSAVLAAASACVISWPAWLKSVGGMCPGLAAGSTISSADGA